MFTDCLGMLKREILLKPGFIACKSHAGGVLKQF